MKELLSNERFLEKCWDLAHHNVLHNEWRLNNTGVARSWFIAIEAVLKLNGYEITKRADAQKEEVK